MLRSSHLLGDFDLRPAELADRLAIFPRYRHRGHRHRPLDQNSKNAARDVDGPDAVLVAGSGLIIRLRKDTVGSTPTRPTKEPPNEPSGAKKYAPRYRLGDPARRHVSDASSANDDGQIRRDHRRDEQLIGWPMSPTPSLPPPSAHFPAQAQRRPSRRSTCRLAPISQLLSS